MEGQRRGDRRGGRAGRGRAQGGRDGQGRSGGQGQGERGRQGHERGGGGQVRAGQGRGGQGQGGQGRGGQGRGGQGRGGQRRGGQGRGGRGGQAGGRRYDDTRDFNAMRDSDEVGQFFRCPHYHKLFLSIHGFTELIMLAKIIHSDNKPMRHQFLIRLSQSRLLEMEGPVAGTIRKYLHGDIILDPDMFNDAINSLLDIMDEMVNRIPHVRNTIPYITTMLSLIDSVMGILEPHTLEKRDRVRQNLSDPTLLMTRINDPNQNWSANVSFIREPIIPPLEELMNTSLDKCYTNPNKGAYQSPAHYLETWFRLMREDFIGPLRDAIKDFQKTYKPTDALKPKRIRLDGGYHYTIEKVLQRDLIDGEYYILVQVCQDELQHVNWGHTDRLRFDSMMVLSNDHFQTGRYAMITSNDARPAKRGQEVWLKLMDGAMEMDSFHGIEPMAFYEPSRCVMERVKVVAARVDEGIELPMQRYLVGVHKSVKRPSYMHYGTRIELPDSTYTMSGALNLSGLGLDHSQEKAMHLALSNELALIQGPPGTGKSYVGAMFVHIMMLNKDLWRSEYDQGCMLLLAYKNHAIDQFIAECERMGMDMSRTVRIGSRSNLAMEKYQLRNRRKELQDLFEYKTMTTAVREKRRELVEAEEYIKYLRRSIRCRNKDMPPNFYNYLMPEFMKYQLWYYKPDGDEYDRIALWLCNGNLQNREAILNILDNYQVIQSDEAEVICNDFAENIYNMPLEFRYQLFVYWCETAREEVERYIIELQKWHDKLSNDMKDIRYAQDVAVVRRADILAMTTTGASKHAHLLDAVKPTIVLCEEAAEVLESHIVAPLTEGCKHVILIGDHQQLRPSVNNFAMEKRNMSISLFERMIQNELPSERLQIQHRMHPEIADLLVPHIYTSLENHPAVKAYPPVMGVKKRMHFFHHNHQEQKVGEKSSCRNPFEADYLVHLTHYLLQQGKYKPTDITILTTYMGQMRLIKDKINTFKQANPKPLYTRNEKIELLAEEFADYFRMEDDIEAGLVKKDEMDNKMRNWFHRRKTEYESKKKLVDTARSKIEDVRVTTVDNYQGEECTIILLSFVRSNKQCNIGFLKWANRICVALSRAKHGFYTIGDFKLFARNEKSDLWKKLCEQLLRSVPDTRLSDKLEIVCANHGTTRCVSEPPHFLELAPEGGCEEKCDHRLVKCGHSCTRMCHPDDLTHDEFICIATCKGSLICGHSCDRRCDKEGDEHSFFKRKDAKMSGTDNFRQCQSCKKLIHCTRIIEIIPPTCGHPGETLCSGKESYICQKPVRFDLDCGHKQKAPCSTKKQDIKCRTPVHVELDCSHTITRPCYDKNPKCKLQIMKRLLCGHDKLICCDDRHDLGITCIEKVEVTLRCGHNRTVPCPQRETTLYETCKEMVPIKRVCGHDTEMPCTNGKEGGRLDELYKKRFMLSQPCDVTVEIKLPCNHEKNVKCPDSTKPQKCEVLVHRTLPCGHKVKEECHKKTVVCEVLKVERLKCGHDVKANCCEFQMVKAQGCTQRVMVSKPCGHKRLVDCRHKQKAIQHEPCTEPCNLKCSHDIKCTKECSRPCPRCMKPCQNQCPHSKCTKRCYQECDRKPCEAQCEKKLPCGHRCSGVCGELCPSVCQLCKPKQARKGRRLRLPCNHDFTTNVIDKHMAVQENAQVQEIVVKFCSMKQCGAVITACPRYANQIKRYLQLPKAHFYDPGYSWWYCKPGMHYVKLDSEASLATAASHDCAAYRQYRLATAEILTEEVREENQDQVARPDALMNNELFRNIMAGRGVGRGRRAAQQPRRDARRPGRQPPVDQTFQQPLPHLFGQLTLNDTINLRRRRSPDEESVASVADTESVADTSDTGEAANSDSDGEDWMHNDLY